MSRLYYFNAYSLPQSNLHIGITDFEEYNINDVQDALDKANDVNMDTPCDIYLVLLGNMNIKLVCK